jgi:hypothetical protein
MAWVTHYYNKRTGELACKHNMGMTAGRGRGSARDTTEDKTQVTCKRCISIIVMWAEMERRRNIKQGA